MEEKGDSNLVGATVTLPQLKDIRKSTPGETYRYLHELIKGKSIENLNELISGGECLSRFDENLRLLLIDCLHLHDEVVNVLLSQNDYQIKRILNCKWYMWFFQNLSSDICTKKLLPYVSQSLRCKIINKLSKHLNNTEEAEKCFAFFGTNYDKTRADYLLPRCSSQFILNHFEKTKTSFEQNTRIRILLNICRRYPEVGIHILSSIFDLKEKQGGDVHCFSEILLYLSGHYPDLMVPLLIKHCGIMGNKIFAFGRRLTRKLGTKLKGRLLPDFAEKIVFRENRLFEILSWEDKAKFIAAIVRCQNAELSLSNWRNSNYRICSLLKMVRRDLREALVQSAFRQVYNSEFSDHSSTWSAELLELLPTKTRRPYVAKLEKFWKSSRFEFYKNVNSDSFSFDNPEGVVYLYDSNTALRKLKNIFIDAPTVLGRKNVLFYIVKNCSINDDVKAMEEPVIIVARRCRNDDPDICYSFLKNVCEFFHPTKLNSDTFEKLEDAAYCFIVQGKRNDYAYNLWRERHVYYRLENGMDVDALVQSIFEFVVLGDFLEDLQLKDLHLEDLHLEDSCTPFVTDVQSKHSKTLILALCKKAVDLLREKSSEALTDSFRNILSRMLETLLQFNEVNKGRRIGLRDIPGLSDILREELKNKFGDVGGESWPVEIWDRYHTDVFDSYQKPRLLLYAFRRRQGLIEKHMEGILNILFSHYTNAYNAFLDHVALSVSFFGKTGEFKELILREFKEGASKRRRRNALVLYSRVCTIEEFSEAIHDHLPKQNEIDREAGEEFNEIQILIPTLIKNVRPRWKNLQLMPKFFYVDFMKIMITSVFSCCHHTRWDLAVAFLKQLPKIPLRTSCHKDITRLMLQLSDKKERSDLCWKKWQDLRFYHIRDVLLRDMFRLFLEQPSRDSYESLEKCFLEYEHNTVDVRPPLSEIPEEFLSDYVSALWRFSEGKHYNFKNECRQEILRNFDLRNISLISADFCEAIIKSHLFISPSEISVERFAALYLAADPHSVQDRVHMILNLIKSHTADSASVDRFFRVLMEISWENSARFADVFEIFLENWPRYPLGVLHKLRVNFTYHSLHQRVVKRTPDQERVPLEFGRELIKMFANVDNLKDLIPVYSEPLSQFFSIFEPAKAIRALRELVTCVRDKTTAVLAISSLPDEAAAWYEAKDDIFCEARARNREIVRELFEIFESYRDDVVEIYLRAKFEVSKPELPID